MRTSYPSSTKNLMMRCAIIHYHELALKGRNRPFFEQRLVRNLRGCLRDLGVTQVESLQGRIRVALGENVPWEIVRNRLARVFGVANFSLAHSVPLKETRLFRCAQDGGWRACTGSCLQYVSCQH